MRSNHHNCAQKVSIFISTVRHLYRVRPVASIIQINMDSQNKFAEAFRVISFELAEILIYTAYSPRLIVCSLRQINNVDAFKVSKAAVEERNSII